MIERTHNECAITLTAEELRTAYCVYVHNLMPDNVNPFYIGVTRLSEAFRHQDAYRNHHWITTVKDDSIIQMAILRSFPLEIDAHRHASKMVQQFRPICNVVGFKVSGRHAITCIQGPNAGTTYGTVTEAAERNGMSQPSLSNHLNAVRGYETVKGMKFKRGLPS